MLCINSICKPELLGINELPFTLSHRFFNVVLEWYGVIHPFNHTQPIWANKIINIFEKLTWPCVCQHKAVNYVVAIWHCNKRAKIFDETLFQTLSWPLEQAKVNLNILKESPLVIPYLMAIVILCLLYLAPCNGNMHDRNFDLDLQYMLTKLTLESSEPLGRFECEVCVDDRWRRDWTRSSLSRAASRCAGLVSDLLRTWRGTCSLSRHCRVSWCALAYVLTSLPTPSCSGHSNVLFLTPNNLQHLRYIPQ